MAFCGGKENGSVPVSECPFFFFLVRSVYTGCVLLDLPWNMSLRRSTKVDRKKTIQEWYVFLKKIFVEKRKKNDRPVSVKSKRPLFVPHWRNDWCVRLPCDMLAGLWKKLKFLLSEMVIGRKKKWNFLRWLVVIDWVYICPFSVRSLHLVLLAPLTPPCICFGTSLFGFLPKKIRGCGSPRATNPLVPCHPFSMQLVWIASTKCRDLYR